MIHHKGDEPCANEVAPGVGCDRGFAPPACRYDSRAVRFLLRYGAVRTAILCVEASATTILAVAGQLLVGVLIDHFGFFDTFVRPFDLLRAAGLVLVLIGAWLVIRSVADIIFLCALL
jgi:hypothetical protein